jgi:ATP-dependent exoDNAse (exonuclease V) beta subunit
MDINKLTMDFVQRKHAPITIPPLTKSVQEANVVSSPLTYLANLYPHERDARIQFDEGPHIYTIDGSSNGYVSVTTFNHANFEQFDADAIIKGMMSSKRWPQSKYYGQTVDEIKAGWDKNRDEAAEAGTKMHYDIECYYNNMDIVNDSVEYEYFQRFLADFPDLKPYRTEWTVFHEELKLAGSIDMVFEKPDGTLLIYDWKRCREIVKTNSFGKWGKKECIEHLPDTNYWHYCLQLNTYKAILEEKYGKVVEDLYLICLHPENKNKNYQRIKVVNLQSEVKELFELRRQEISKPVSRI